MFQEYVLGEGLCKCGAAGEHSTLVAELLTYLSDVIDSGNVFACRVWCFVDSTKNFTE